MEREIPGKITAIAVNWREEDLPVPPERLQRMMRQFHPAINVVKGISRTAKDFADVKSIPAVFIFDRQGREVFRQGGEPGPDGLHYLRREQLADVIRNMK